ncbi:MAG: hypothetical protein M1514_01020 [Patescibacteria group bacterium]|nr:hypothetical protein [Patescibacteria group bacterium]
MANYGNKRPIWQWVLVYLIIGLIIYGAIYYFVIARNRVNYISPVSPSPTSEEITITEEPSPTEGL